MNCLLTSWSSVTNTKQIRQFALSLFFSLMIIVGLSMAKVDLAWAGGEINMLTKGGAKADNKTDNLPMINKALKAGYTILYFPAGTYVVSGQINLTSQSILGDGPAKTVIHLLTSIAPAPIGGVWPAIISTSGTCAVTGVTIESEQTHFFVDGTGNNIDGINAVNGSISVKSVKFSNVVRAANIKNDLFYGLWINNLNSATVSSCDFESGVVALMRVAGGKNITISQNLLNGGGGLTVMPAQAGATVANVNILSNTFNSIVVCAGLLNSKINSNKFTTTGVLQVVGDTFDKKQIVYPAGGFGYPGPVNTVQIASNQFASSSLLNSTQGAGMLWLGAVSGSLPAVQNVQVVNNILVAPAADLKEVYSLYHNLTSGNGIAVTGIDLHLGGTLTTVAAGASRGVKNIVLTGNTVSNMISNGIVLDVNGNVAVSKNPSISNCRAEAICVGPDSTGAIEIAYNTIVNTGFDASLPEKQLSYAVIDVQAIGTGTFTGNKDSTTLPNSIASALKAGHTTQVVPTVVDNVYKGPANHNLFGYRNTP